MMILRKDGDNLPKYVWHFGVLTLLEDLINPNA